MDALRVAALLVALALSSAAAPPDRTGVVAYDGAGAWVDRYDFAKLGDPALAVDAMAAHGVKTIYVETASYRVPGGVDVVAPAKTAQLIASAHADGMKAVGWYFPGLVDLRTDMRRVRAALGFRTADGQSFDSIALDIESNLVNPVRRRNAALLRLSGTIRRAAGDAYAVGAIVPDERSTAGTDGLWPHFPYAASARYYDVFLPMAYSTLNRARGAAPVYAYTAANVRFVRRATHRPVHLIAGLTNAMTASEQSAAARAARDTGAVGASFYKYPLYNRGSWAALSAFAQAP